jgi:Rrf2 family cysteine metabolism transcriptional repressor
MAVGISNNASFSMRVSSKAHYGLRMMTEFARSYGQGPHSLADVARDEHLPQPYLEQLAAQLRRGGLIESTRGVHGGYTLTRSPKEISVLDVVGCVEGEVAPVDCLASQGLWRRLKSSIDAVLSSTSLADLVVDGGLVDALAPIPMATARINHV